MEKKKKQLQQRELICYAFLFRLMKTGLQLQVIKKLYIAVTAPDGRPVTMASGSGTFDTREEGTKTYTNKVNIPYEQGKRSTVNFDWKQEGNTSLVQYKIEVYHNGYKIGEGTKTLKKGGLFG